MTRTAGPMPSGTSDPGSPGTARGPARKLIGFSVIGSAAVALILLTQPDVSWPGLVAMLVFYGLFYYLGAVVATRRSGAGGGGLRDTMVAGRSMPLWIGVFTMTATWVGGGYIGGTAEATYASGLAWAQAPWGYALSLIVGGLVFAGPMRRRAFLTMLDPIDIRFGARTSGLAAIPAMIAELFWSGAILVALGTTFGTILGLDFTISILLSAAVAVAYTVVGGMWSVAITDVVQVGIIFLGLFLAIPFMASSVGGFGPAWSSYQDAQGAYAALFPPLTGWDDPAWGVYWWNWWDFMLLLIFGGLAWQVYFQRVLSARNVRAAKGLSYGAGLLAIVAATAPMMIAVLASSADFGPELQGQLDANPALILPFALRYLLPTAVAALALGAVAAAVMSSVDSSVLSASSVGGWNIYKRLIRPDATAGQVQTVIRRLIVVVGAAAALLALNVGSVYVLWYLASDLVYVLVFPMLTCALFVKRANRTGILAGFAVAGFLRVSGGEAALGLDPFLPWMWQEDGAVLFPFRTVAMLCNFATVLVVSYLTRRGNPPVPMAELEEGSASRILLEGCTAEEEDPRAADPRALPAGG